MLSGINDKIIEFFLDQVVLHLLNKVGEGMTVKLAYADCCRVFPESMRQG